MSRFSSRRSLTILAALFFSIALCLSVQAAADPSKGWHPVWQITNISGAPYTSIDNNSNGIIDNTENSQSCRSDPTCEANSIYSTGPAGIATTIPTPPVMLDVGGYVSLSNQLNIRGAGGWAQIQSLGSNTPLYITTTGYGNIILNTAGNVGIGTNNPLRKLHIVSDVDSSALVMEVLEGQADWRKWSFQLNGGTGSPQNLYLRIISDAGSIAMLNAMSWLANGNVGIGMTGPGARLQINNTVTYIYPTPGQTTGTVHLSAADANSVTNALTFGGPAGYMSLTEAGIYSSVAFGVGSTLHLATTDDFNAGAKVRVTIKPSGSVGIGTTNPAQKLEVAGQILATDICTTAGKCLSSAGGLSGGVQNYIPKWTGASTLGNSVIYDNGNVGIGTTAPTTAKLVVSGPAAAEGLDLSSTDQYANLRVIRNSLSSTDKDMYIGFNSGAGSKLHLYSNNVETLSVSGGNVGIGTPSPGYKLDVNGNARVTDFYLTDGVQIEGLSGRNYFRDTEGAGNLRVGAVWGMPGIYAESGVGVLGGAGGASLQNNALFVTTGGNVGIGTSGPGAKLDVSGNIHATGDICTDQGGGKCLSVSSGYTGILCGWCSHFTGGNILLQTCQGLNVCDGSCPAGYHWVRHSGLTIYAWLGDSHCAKD